MVDKTISALTAGGAITDSVLFEAENPAGVTSTKQTASDIATYMATKGAALSKADDTNVTLALTGTPATALLNAATITAGWTGQLSLARGGTGANLVDPNADRVLFWDDSAGQVTWLTMGTNLTITGTTLDASGGGSPGGSDTQVQFNDAAAFGGDAGLVYNKTTNVLTITGSGNSGATAPITVLPSSGASFTKINDNGTVVIDSDVSTGANPLTLKYNGGSIYQFNFGGTFSLLAGAALENIAWGSYINLTRPVNTGILKLFVGGGAGGTFSYLGKTPTQITGDQNDYQPWGVEPSYFQRWSSDASRNITGLTQSVTKQDGQVHLIVNVGSQNIVLKHLSASSVKTNQFRNSTGADITLSAGQAADIIYDVAGTNGTDATGVWLVFKRN